MPKFTETRVSMLHGILLIALFACAAFYIGEAQILKDISFSPMIIGIILGMLYANSLRNHLPETWVPGIQFCSKKVLRLGIILYGFRLTFQDIVNVGVAGIVVDVIIVVVTILGGIWIGRLLKMDRDTALLTSVGSGICGAAAVLGAESTIRTQAYKTAVAVATVVIFGTISMFLYPIAYRSGWVDLTPQRWVSILVPLFMRWLMQSGPAMPWYGDFQCLHYCQDDSSDDACACSAYSGVWAARRNAKDGATAEKGKVNIPWFAVGFLAVIDSTPSICFRIFLSTQSTMLIRSYLQWPWLPWVQRQVLISLRRPVPSRLFLHSASMSGLLSVAISLPNILPRFACRDIIPQ